MVQLKYIKILYALAILVMPISYATKLLLGFSDITWINPTLLISVILFAIIIPKVKLIYLLIILSGFISAFIGVFWLSPEGLYSVIREPMRMLLNMLWFLISVWMLKSGNYRFVAKWLSISVILQFIISIWFFLHWFNIISVPNLIGAYLEEHRFSQAVSLGNIVVPRLTGSFTEGPPFGLFMISSFFIFFIIFYIWRDNSVWVKNGLIFSLLGTIGSLSGQIFFALGSSILLLMIFSINKKRYHNLIMMFLIFGMVASPYVIHHFSYKLDEAMEVVTGESGTSYGTSGGERTFHIIYSLNILSDSPLRLITGIGPGRYGEYAVEIGFPKTVTPQVTLIEWLVGYGIIGTMLIIMWIIGIGKLAFKFNGIIGIFIIIGLLIANGFQANWLWESFFLALAFLMNGNYYSDYRIQRKT